MESANWTADMLTEEGRYRLLINSVTDAIACSSIA
jgi:hypothetical protein